jgi:hypothetical protein
MSDKCVSEMTGEEIRAMAGCQPAPEPSDPVAQLHRIAEHDIGGNAPWLAEKLHAFAFQLAAEMRGECQLEVVRRTNAVEAKLAAVKARCEAGGLVAAGDILAIIIGSEQEPQI